MAMLEGGKHVLDSEAQVRLQMTRCAAGATAGWSSRAVSVELACQEI